MPSAAGSRRESVDDLAAALLLVVAAAERAGLDQRSRITLRRSSRVSITTAMTPVTAAKIM